MRRAKNFEGRDPEDNVIELFPQRRELGPTIMVSKEHGLGRALLGIVKRLESSDEPAVDEDRFGSA